MEALLPAEGRDRNARALELFAPGAGLVEAADRHRHLRLEPANDLEDEPFGSARVEAEDDLKDAGSRAGHVGSMVRRACVRRTLDKAASR